MKKFSAKLPSFKFEYEFLDGSKAQFEFKDLNTKQIKEFARLSKGGIDEDEAYEIQMRILEENITGDETLKEKMFEELEEYGNIFEFLSNLQKELGKLRKRG